MYKKNQGYGICGSKNVYSSNVKLGNWVEDSVGQDLVAKGRNVEAYYVTNTALAFKDPNEQPPLPAMPVNMPTTQELKAKNTEGTPYSLNFDHGLKESPPEVSIPLNPVLLLHFTLTTSANCCPLQFIGTAGDHQYADHYEKERRPSRRHRQ
jgi:hypothetical protein